MLISLLKFQRISVQYEPCADHYNRMVSKRIYLLGNPNIANKWYDFFKTYFEKSKFKSQILTQNSKHYE